MKLAVAISSVFLLAACASNTSALADKTTVVGRYKYEFGDTLQYNCGKPQPCVKVLVRDQFLRAHVNDLDGKTITLDVTKIDACHDPRSTSFACVTSGDGTAFLILKWINPAATLERSSPE